MSNSDTEPVINVEKRRKHMRTAVAVGLRTGDVLQLGRRSLNVSLACQFCALLSHVLTLYHPFTVVDSCCITRSRVLSTLFWNCSEIITWCVNFSAYLSVGKLSMNESCKRFYVHRKINIDSCGQPLSLKLFGKRQSPDKKIRYYLDPCCPQHGLSSSACCALCTATAIVPARVHMKLTRRRKIRVQICTGKTCWRGGGGTPIATVTVMGCPIQRSPACALIPLWSLSKYTVLFSAIRRRDTSLCPAPLQIPVFTGLELHSTAHVAYLTSAIDFHWIAM